LSEVEIYRQLATVFAEVFDDDTIELSQETTADDIADWDSFNHVTLVVAIEQRFGIKFGTAEIEGLRNVGEMVALIARKLQGAAVRA
jgi:acyl carrier protein